MHKQYFIRLILPRLIYIYIFKIFILILFNLSRRIDKSVFIFFGSYVLYISYKVQLFTRLKTRFPESQHNQFNSTHTKSTEQLVDCRTAFDNCLDLKDVCKKHMWFVVRLYVGMCCVRWYPQRDMLVEFPQVTRHYATCKIYIIYPKHASLLVTMRVVTTIKVLPVMPMLEYVKYLFWVRFLAYSEFYILFTACAKYLI